MVTDESMFNQLDMVFKLLFEYAERAASKLRASGEHGGLSLMGPLILPPIAPSRSSCMCGACARTRLQGGHIALNGFSAAFAPRRNH